MKLKVRPEDFVVEEQIGLTVSSRGPYTILKMVKNSWNTLDAIDLIARKLGIARGLISRAGLKDRYALTTQYLSYRGDLRRGFEEKNLSLIPLGKSEEPVTPAVLKGNKFTVTLRSLDEDETEKVTRNHCEVIKIGLPNYFDDQRFGSAWHKQGFFARALILGHCQGALKLLLCYSYADEAKPARFFKKFCLENWGQWDEIFLKAPREYQKIIAFLVRNPGDFKNAIKQLDREMLNLYLLAYQSYIFNEILVRIMTDHSAQTVSVPYSVGQMVFGRELRDPEFLNSLTIPMINDRTRLHEPLAAILHAVIEREGVSIKGFGLNKMRFRGVRFKTFPRRAVVFPADFAINEPENDDLYPGKGKMKIEFTMPPGSYATILIKRLLI
jgi:tRNA pseudouridine13 synthase